jgi:predicted DNA-binding protein
LRRTAQKTFGGKRSRIAATRLPLTAYAGLGALALVRGTTRGRILRELVERLLTERQEAPIVAR